MRGMGRQVVALWFVLARFGRSASLTKLQAKNADLLKTALFGGDCWVIACTDMSDGGTGQQLLEKAMDYSDAAEVCKGATLKCEAKLPSGKTALSRLGLKGPAQAGHPLLIVAANGEASSVPVEQYAYVDNEKQSATPDARRLAKHIGTAGAAQGHTRVLHSYFNSRVFERSQMCQEPRIHRSRP